MRTLLAGIGTTLGWFVSLGGKFFSVAPTYTLAVQATTLASQFLLLLAFFLPLKVVILLGSEVVPSYLPDFLKALGRDPLIILISVAALLCYLAYGVMEFLVVRLSRYGASRLLEKSDKSYLFDNQGKFAVDTYIKYARGLAAGVFSLATFSILIFIYFELFFVVVMYSVVAFMVICAACSLWWKLKRFIFANVGGFLNGVASIGFLIAFFCMIADFLYSEHPVVLVAIISLLLVRQGLQRLANLIQTLIQLRAQYRRINALFFHGHPLLLDNERSDSSISGLLHSPEREVWFQQVLTQVTGKGVSIVDIRWQQLGVAGIHCFTVHCVDTRGGIDSVFLLKLYEKHLASQAEREALLLHGSALLPSLPFLGKGEVAGFGCLAFLWPDVQRIPAAQLHPSILNFSRQLMAIEPPAERLQQFRRSHPFLEQRLNEALIEPLRLVADTPEERSLTVRLFERWSDLIHLLASLPRQLIAPDMNLDTLVQLPSGEVHAIHWANWRIEPLGAGWPYLKLEQLPAAVIAVRERRDSASAVHPSAVAIASLMMAMERLCAAKKYQGALELLFPLMHHLELLDAAKMPEHVENA